MLYRPKFGFCAIEVFMGSLTIVFGGTCQQEAILCVLGGVMEHETLFEEKSSAN